MLEALATWGAAKIAAYVGGSIAVVIVGWILHKIPTGKWSKKLGEAGQNHGKAVSAYFTAKLGAVYTKAIEPFFIDTLAVIPSYVAGFVIGLKSDNPE